MKTYHAADDRIDFSCSPSKARHEELNMDCSHNSSGHVDKHVRIRVGGCTGSVTSMKVWQSGGFTRQLHRSNQQRHQTGNDVKSGGKNRLKERVEKKKKRRKLVM